MGQFEGRNDAEPNRAKPLRPFEEADRIVERVMGPMNERGHRIDVEICLMKPKVMAVVGPQHHG
jgi:hypothetical protein